MIIAAKRMTRFLTPGWEVPISTPVAAPPATEFLEPMSFGARFAGIFLSPGATFADIVRKTDWVAPLLVMVGSAVVFTETMLWKIGMDRIVRMSIERSSGAAQMTPEQIERAVTQSAKIGAIFAHAGALLGAPIYFLIVAGLGLLILTAVFDKELDFTTAFFVTCYAGLPGILASLMGLAMIFLGDMERFNPGNPTPTNVGFFLNPLETSKPMYALASSMDVFTVWFLILLGIGFSAATGQKVKASSVFYFYFALWMIWVFGKMGFALLM